MAPSIPRVALGHWPTPLERLERLSQHLGGPRLWVKRDDLTGLATGGNKTRKLEYLIADALQQKAHTVITAGAPQSNHARQTAAAAARYGLGCVLVLGPVAPPSLNGNLLIDRLVGARIRWTGDRDRSEVMQEVADEERAAGRKPYVIPVGGSNALGAVGYVMAMDELARQMAHQEVQFEHIVVASGSGGTQAGMVAGARAVNYRGRITGISVGPPAEGLGNAVYELAQRTVSQLGLRFTLAREDVVVNDGYRGAGYGVLGEAEREAIHLAARLEGLLLDPVYTGRAMAGLMDLIRRGEFGPHERVLFWHTGGTAGLFAYAEEL